MLLACGGRAALRTVRVVGGRELAAIAVPTSAGVEAGSALWLRRRRPPRARPLMSRRLYSVRGGGSDEGEEHALVRQLYDAYPAPQVVVYSTGAGGHLAHWMLTETGASAVLLELSVPYGHQAVDELIGGEPPGGYCSGETARALARAAHRRAVALQLSGAGALSGLAASALPHVGVGCTAAIITGRPRRGEHRAYIASCTEDTETLFEITLAKDQRSRAEEDRVVSAATLRVLADAALACVSAQPGRRARPDGVSARLAAQVLGLSGDRVAEPVVTRRPPPLDRMQRGDANLVLYVPHSPSPPGRPRERPRRGLHWPTAKRAESLDGDASHVAWCDAPIRDAIVFPGSFNPLHHGHERMAAAAVELVGPGSSGRDPRGGSLGVRERGVVFEITTRNADKGALDAREIERRALQFVGRDGIGAPVVLTRAKLFVDKARLFSNCTFVVGADTVARLIDPSYYGGSAAEMAASLASIRERGCDFLVAGRLVDGAYTTLDGLIERVPPSLRPMFTTLHEDGSAFRVDVSSTELRAAAAAAHRDEGAEGAEKGGA